MEHEHWLTALFNAHLAGVATAVLSLAGQKTAERPWSTSLATEILVAIVIVAVFAILRSQLSMDRPSKLQQSFEVIYDFLHSQAEENVGHGGPKKLYPFGTLFIFISFANLTGDFPTFESPSMFPEVRLCFARGVFIYFNLIGVVE